MFRHLLLFEIFASKEKDTIALSERWLLSFNFRIKNALNSLTLLSSSPLSVSQFLNCLNAIYSLFLILSICHSHSTLFKIDLYSFPFEPSNVTSLPASFKFFSLISNIIAQTDTRKYRINTFYIFYSVHTYDKF